VCARVMPVGGGRWTAHSHLSLSPAEICLHRCEPEHRRRHRRFAPAPDRLLLTPEQAAERLNICRTTVFQLLRTGQLRSVRIGRSRRITPAALVSYVNHLVDGE
jgi:excisionase family DNA binding protein